MERLLREAKNRDILKQRFTRIGYANIKIMGCGGAGNNTINRLMKIGIMGAKCVAINTDHQHLEMIDAHQKVLIGKNLTRGLGAGGNPEIGRAAAEESREELKSILKESDLVFITCGEGGGTGTGSAPIVAEIAKLEGAIVVGVATLPFKTEIGRIEIAKQGIEAFSVADEVLATMVKGITETISLPSLINLDFADVRTILGTGGVAIVGIGESSGNGNRVEEAISDALNTPLLDVSINGAKGALIHVCGGNDMTLAEANSVASNIYEKMDMTDSMVIWGARVSEEFDGFLRVMLLITGIQSPQIFGNEFSLHKPSFGGEIAQQKLGLSSEYFNLKEITD